MTTSVVKELQNASHRNQAFVGFGQEHRVTCAELDPQEYYRRNAEKKANKKQKYGKFVKFEKISLKGWNIWDDQLNNATVRDEQNKDNADESIAYSLETDGWLYDFFPPILSTEGKVKDGRTRIRAALKAKWTHILVAIFSYDETEVSEEYATITNGLIANKHYVARTASMADFVKAGTELIRLGELERELSSIEEWLINDVEIGNFFDVGAGTHTKICLLYTSPSPRDRTRARMPSSA